MGVVEIAGIILAGVAAGAINVVVGSGTLVTFPTLLFFGYPPVTANVSNSLGLVAGGLSGAWGYRRELRQVRSMALRMVPFTIIGSIIGAILLLFLPEEAFETIVPVLIGLSLVLVVLGPRLSKWTAQQESSPDGGMSTLRWVGLLAGVVFAGMYGGYFGAAQGVLLLGLLSVLLPLHLQVLNGLKNLLVMVANLVAAIAFLIVAGDHIHWGVVGLIALGSLVGGALGARVGRAMPPWLLRTVILVIGTIAIIFLLV